MTLLNLLLSALLLATAVGALEDKDWPKAVDLPADYPEDLKSLVRPFIKGPAIGVIGEMTCPILSPNQFLMQNGVGKNPYITALNPWFKWQSGQWEGTWNFINKFSFKPEELKVSCMAPSNGLIFDWFDCHILLTDQFATRTDAYIRKSFSCADGYKLKYTPVPFTTGVAASGDKLTCSKSQWGPSTFELEDTKAGTKTTLNLGGLVLTPPDISCTKEVRNPIPPSLQFTHTLVHLTSERMEREQDTNIPLDSAGLLFDKASPAMSVADEDEIIEQFAALAIVTKMDNEQIVKKLFDKAVSSWMDAPFLSRLALEKATRERLACGSSPFHDRLLVLVGEGFDSIVKQSVLGTEELRRAFGVLAFVVQLYNYTLLPLESMSGYVTNLIQWRGKTKMGQCLLRVVMLLLSWTTEKRDLPSDLSLDDFTPVLLQHQFGDERKRILYTAGTEMEVARAIEEGLRETRYRWNKRRRQDEESLDLSADTMEELVEALSEEKKVEITQLKRENAELKGENDELKKQLEEVNKKLIMMGLQEK